MSDSYRYYWRQNSDGSWHAVTIDTSEPATCPHCTTFTDVEIGERGQPVIRAKPKDTAQ